MRLQLLASAGPDGRSCRLLTENGFSVGLFPGMPIALI